MVANDRSPAGLQLAIPLGIAALVFGILGIRRAPTAGTGKGMAIAGLAVFFVQRSPSGGADQPGVSELPAPGAPVPGIGEKVVEEPFTFTVESISCSSEPGNETLGEDKCSLSLRVYNNDNTAEYTFDRTEQFLLDAEGRQYEASGGFQEDFKEPVPPYRDLPGSILFDVPEGVVPAYAELHESFASDGVLVRLK